MALEWHKVMMESDIKDVIGISGDAGNGNIITQGIKQYVSVPYNANIIGYSIISGRGEAGNILVDVWKKNGEKPTITDSITDGNYCSLSANDYYYTNDLTDWTTTTVAEQDVLCFNVIADSTIQSIKLNLWINKT